jgi:hypothetical protein
MRFIIKGRLCYHESIGLLLMLLQCYSIANKAIFMLNLLQPYYQNQIYPY